MHWTDRAYCRTLVAGGLDPDTWWPAAGLADGPDVRHAKAACALCEVRRDCLAYALAAGEAHGVWGGLTPVERRRVTTAVA